ncbi:Aldo/keto reductase [Armillaria gallica]|uniref:Aldo/keto reductase n=1 Tax=Armillaria gallica TaxID=47427 RepID=A0A2H3D990_ARMGA|nr:Aldo/keto reductase [Armillaria gallica]
MSVGHAKEASPATAGSFSLYPNEFITSLFQVASDPPTKLGIYRVLSSRTGVRVSPLVLGAMNVGDKWEVFGMRWMNKPKESSFELLDAYFDMGGNFIDTANFYQDETPEEFLGEWAEKRGIRDQLVIATKYTSNCKRGKTLLRRRSTTQGTTPSSVEVGPQKLQTSYIDILYVHWWGFEPSIPEVMDSLHNFVAAQKVLYLGISVTPAWVVAQANQYAMDHSKTPFFIYQGKWSALSVGRGRTRKVAYGRGGTAAEGDGALEKVAAEVGVGSNIGAVAIVYVMHKTPNIFPIIGGRKVEQLESNLEAYLVV